MGLHVMIDLETLDTVASAKILSLGAVLFDQTGAVLNRLYVELEVGSQSQRTMSDSTLRWWLRQSAEARMTLGQEKDTRVTVEHALRRLQQLTDKWTNVKVWSNGANFDEPILSHAYAELGLPTPWKFWNVRCYRTVKSLFARNVPEQERAGTAHNALDDAVHQAHHLIAIHRAGGNIL